MPSTPSASIGSMARKDWPSAGCEDLLFEVTDWTIVTAVRRWLDRWLTFTRRQSFRRRHSLAKLETMIKEAIARGARRQVRVVVTPLRREVVRLRRKVTDLQATVTTLRRSAVGWNRLMEAAPTIPQVSEEDAKAARLSPRLIESLRRRLGLSQMALARLVGVSATAVAHWAAGDSMPTGQNRMTLVALRRVGKREAKELLARRVKEMVSRRRRTRKRPARRPRKRLERRRQAMGVAR